MEEPPHFFSKVMSEIKQATTVERQIEILRERGMVISEPEHVKKVLLSVGYYRMGFYWYPFEIAEPKKKRTHKFRKDTTWEKVEALYDFDNRFRNLLSYYLHIIETDIRTYITYTASNLYQDDPLWFVNPKCVGTDFITKFPEIYDNVKKNEVIKHHHSKYQKDVYAPAWKTLEFLMFGEVQHLYDDILDNSLRQTIYERYHIESEAIFKSYIDTLRMVRNVCAHSHILYDKKLYRGIKGPNSKLGLKAGEEFSIVGVLKLVYYMLRQIDPDTEVEMRNSLRNLVNKVDYDIVRFAISRLAI